MSQCKFCGRSGFFLRVNDDGLCNSCLPIVVTEVKSRARVINESMNLVENGKTLSTRITRCELIIEFSNALRKFEQLGIPTTNPSPSQLVYQYQKKHNEILIQGLNDELRKTLEKTKIEISPKVKINHLSKLLIMFREYENKYPEVSQICELENKLVGLISRVQLDTYMDSARKAEFKGNKKKAIDQYYEALYFLQNDEIDDGLQSEIIDEIKEKINELSSTNTNIIDI